METPLRVCGLADAAVAAPLLHDLNIEFDTAAPPVAVPTKRIVGLIPPRPPLEGDRAALLTPRSPQPARAGYDLRNQGRRTRCRRQRFYRSHGFTEIEYPHTGERAFCFHREI